MAIFVILLILFMPMRAAIGMISGDNNLLRAQNINGPIWSGQISNVEIAGFSMGQINAGLLPLPLFMGRGELAFSSDKENNKAMIEGVIFGGLGGNGIKNLNGEAQLQGKIGKLLGGNVIFNNFNVHFKNDICSSAKGEVKLLLNGGILSSLDINEGMTAQASCDGADLSLSFISFSEQEMVKLRVNQAGKYNANIIILTDDPAMMAGLGLLGFTPYQAGMIRRETGQF
ncbi:type II secretion system protein N [Sphingorhabdus lutea]|nr:type II secretion system protein N [Sphingorhabdus lutea]